MNNLKANVRLYQGEGNTLAFADLTIAGAFVIKDIKVLKPKDGGAPFVAFPSRKGKDEKYYDLAHPITAEAYHAAKETVLSAYEKAKAGA